MYNNKECYINWRLTHAHYDQREVPSRLDPKPKPKPMYMYLYLYQTRTAMLLHISACTCVHVHVFDRAPTEFRFLSLKAQVASSPGPPLVHATGLLRQISLEAKTTGCTCDSSTLLRWARYDFIHQERMSYPKGRPLGTYAPAYTSIAGINKLEAISLSKRWVKI